MAKILRRNAAMLFLMAACFAHAADYGVGFSLSLDYGVASVHFSNGTTVDITKIEGGPAYKQFMRGPEIFNEFDMDHLPLLDNPSAGQIPLGLQSIREYLPSWFGGIDVRALPLSRMLKALKTASESYIESSLSDAEVVFPFPVSKLYLDILRSACSSLSLNMPRSAHPPAGILAARAYGIGIDEDPDQLILTVDYSGAALTALLVVEESNVFECRRVLHDTSLGADNLSGSESSHWDLWRALRTLTKLPLTDGYGEELTGISQLVLMGESADDQTLQITLKEILREQSPNIVSIRAEGEGVSPLFAAARGVAQECEGRLNFQSYRHNGL